MTIRHIRTLGRAAIRSVRYLLDGDVRFPTDRLGYVLELPTDDRFLVYRETVRQSALADDSDERVVLVFRMHVNREVSGGLRSVLFDPVANVATPFFAGMPGFRRKLWLAGERPGEFLELYEWASRADADRFVAVLQSLLAPFAVAGDASFDVVPDDSIDEYLAARSIQWHDASAQRRWRESRLRPGRAALFALAVFGVGYLLWRRVRRPPRRTSDATGKEA